MLLPKCCSRTGGGNARPGPRPARQSRRSLPSPQASRVRWWIVKQHNGQLTPFTVRCTRLPGNGAEEEGSTTFAGMTAYATAAGAASLGGSQAPPPTRAPAGAPRGSQGSRMCDLKNACRTPQATLTAPLPLTRPQCPGSAARGPVPNGFRGAVAGLQPIGRRPAGRAGRDQAAKAAGRWAHAPKNWPCTARFGRSRALVHPPSSHSRPRLIPPPSHLAPPLSTHRLRCAATCRSSSRAGSRS